jgi:predicted ArsR family transcriptional regulator
VLKILFKLWRRLEALFAVGWYRAVVQFPMAGQDKWQGLNELLVQVVQAELQQRDGDATMPAENGANRPLELAAARWMWRRSEWLAGSAAPAEALDDLLTATFKTLNMASRLHVSGSTLRVTTFHCPFIEHTRRGEPFARRICEQMCSERHSMFRGLVQGMPLAVAYFAPQKMGCGDEACVKVFRLLADKE